jgi:hypothetical protein
MSNAMAAAKCAGARASRALPGHRRRQSALMLAARMTQAHFLGFVHDEVAEGGGRTRNHGAAQLGDAPNFKNRTQGGPWRGRCGRRDPSRQPDPLDFVARLITPKLTPDNLYGFIEALF